MRSLSRSAWILAVIFASFGSTARGQEFGSASVPVEHVPLVSLLANGREFDGKRVWVAGVLRIEFEGDSLYLTKDHYTHRVSQNAVWLNLDLERLGASRKRLAESNGRYVFVSGVFSDHDRGHMSMFEGSIRQVDHIRVLMPVD